jgi:4-hydroxy-tetrahydrodipicolinate reductase
VSAPDAPIRVVQWATGNIGTRSLRAVIEHQRLELAGVRVYEADKVGRDAGELCGLPPVGIDATDDIEQILACGADCVLYMPRACDVDDVCRLLAAGMDVVSTRGEFHRPASLDADVRERIESACREGGTSIHSTGSSPGFITEALPLVLLSLERRLDRLVIDEFADLSKRNSPELLFRIMGFGQAPSRVDERRLGHLRDAFGPSLQVLAEAVGITLDSVEVEGELATASRRIEIAAGVIEPGTVAGQRITVSGMRHGREVLCFRANWFCSTDLSAEWALESTGWRVAVEGDVPMDVHVRFDVPLERMAETSPGFTAHRAVNAVAAVHAADPGIRTSVDLPPILPDLETT